MKKQILSVALTLCLFISSQSVVNAEEIPSPQEDVLIEESASEPDAPDSTTPPPEEVYETATVLQQEDVLTEESTSGLITRDNTIPTPTEVYDAMIAFRNQDGYTEGTTWTDYEPYSDSLGYYRWNGGTLTGANIVAVGCVAFAFTLSDAAFGNLQASMYAAGDFSYEDIKVGDILRVANNTHTVIVLEVSDAGVVVAEGNYNGTVHWGRTISKADVMNNTSYYITRYPKGYISPDDPTANDIIIQDSLDGGLSWKLTKAGTITISGNGAMPDFSSAEEQPWIDYSSQIRKVIIENGVTGIGSCAFGGCGVLSAEIPSSVTMIGNSAFRGSSIISATIPSSVTTVGDSAFRECQGLSSISVSEGVETIGPNAFRSCTSLTSIALPASIGEVGAGAFFQCTEMKSATFAAGSKQVKFGDNIFTQCYDLMSVTLPQSIDCIGEGMFQNCLMLANVEIPQGAERIGGSAFASCSRLTSVIIPDSVTTIETAAFSACSQLADIYFTGTETQWNSISKQGDTISAVSKATIHYEYIPGPFIDDSGTNGWIEITNEAKKASEGTQISVNMNNTSEVPRFVLDSIKGKDVTISFDMGDDVIWSVNGMDVDQAENVNLFVEVKKASEIDIPQDIVDTKAEDREAIELSLAHSGDFGYSAVLKVDVGSDNADLYANLYYYNKNVGELEFITADQIDKDGFAELTFTHASDYLIVIDNKDDSTPPDDDGNGDNDGNGGNSDGNGGSNGGNGGSNGGNDSNGGSNGGNDGNGSNGGNNGSTSPDGNGSGGNNGSVSPNGSSSNGSSSGNSSSSASNNSSSQRTKRRSPRTGEFDIGIGETNATDLQHEEIDLNFMWLLLIGAVGIAMAKTTTCLIKKKVNK